MSASAALTPEPGPTGTAPRPAPGSASVRTAPPRRAPQTRAPQTRGRPAARTASGPGVRAAARTAARTTARGPAPYADPGPTPPVPGLARATALRLVPQGRPRAARAPFAVLVVALLAGGLLGLLGLNTVLAQDAFRLHSLQVEGKQLSAREQVLQREVQDLQAPAALSQQATALGMVPGGPPAFLRLPDGAVLGQPMPAAAPAPAPTVAAVPEAVDVAGGSR